MLKKIISSSLNKLGYQLISTNRFGIDYLLDINHILSDSQLSSHLPITENHVIFDVGANIGQTSMKFSFTYPNGKIYAFEPIETTFNELKLNVSKLKNVCPYQIGLGDKVEQKDIYIYGSSVLSSFVAKSPMMSSDSSVNSFSVTINTLDNFCLEHQINYIDILKIDTEGFDLNVLQGAERLLERQAVSFIYFEFFRIDQDNDDTTGGRLIDIHNHLMRFGLRPVSFYTDFIHHQHTAGIYNALYMKWK